MQISYCSMSAGQTEAKERLFPVNLEKKKILFFYKKVLQNGKRNVIISNVKNKKKNK